MNIRKQRNHQSGHSNIDFRSKKDENSLKLFQPWKVMEAPGTMGYSGYKPNTIDVKNILEVSKKINTQRVVSTEIPDPKYHKTAEFYYKNRIPIKTKTIYTNERIAQLDESFKGKEVFTGDSMMISDINKYRKNKIKKKMDDTEKLEKQRIQENIIRDKNQKNKGAIQETQLCNIDADVTVDTKVDINKIKEIRYALRRRYANRTNFRKIFKEWDYSNMGEINLYDAHSMLKKLGIPTNYNETLALIASSNKRDSETINLEEFMHLIFSDNNAVEIDLKKIKFKDEKVYVEGEQLEKLKRKMRESVVETSKTNELNFVKEYLRIRIPSLAKYFNEVAVKDGICDYESLSNVIKKFPLPEKYKSTPILDAIYSQYSSRDSHLMDYKKFIHDIINSTNTNYFFDFKDEYLNKIKEKIETNTQTIYDSIGLYSKEAENKKNLKLDFERAIQKNEKTEDNITREINNTIPSTEFINKVFSNKEAYFHKHKEIEKEFSPHPSLLKGIHYFNFTEIKPKTRYGANPPHQNTFINIQAPQNSAPYISERERFHNRKLDSDFLDHEKEKRNNYQLHKIEKLKNLYKNVAEDKAIKENLVESKDIQSLLQRTKKSFKYELINKLRNDIVE